MKMKKAKLFMMLALLVMGVSNVMGATKDFYVNYERDFLTGTGYNIASSTGYYTIQKFSALTTQGLDQIGDRMIRVTYNGNTAPSAATIAQYITAIGKTGYTTRVVGIDNTIYICYIWNEAFNRAYRESGKDGYTIELKNSVITSHEWTPTGTGSHLTYSDLYVKTDSRQVKNVIKLGDDECAVRLNTYTDSEVTIPLVDPTKGYDVVAIQSLGMCEEEPHELPIVNCEKYNDDIPDWQWEYYGHYSSEYGCYIIEGTQTNSHSNSNLTKVTFEKNATTGQSNIESIADYAFQSCKVLTTIEIPQSIKYLGEASFSQCVGLTDGFTFQRTSGASFTTNFKVIRNYTFWNCRNMTDLELPDGIIVIQGQQSGSSMQYMTSLTNLRLPNTLLAIGPHFLCDASSLTSVTIPASVKYIDGACFHGCESLQEVYLLGPASALQGVYDGSDTFGANRTMCKDHVSQCVFITTQENIEGYATDANGVWQLIGDNKDGNCSATLYAVAVDDKGQAVRDDDGNFVIETDENGDPVPLTYENGSPVETKKGNRNVCSKNWNNALTYFPDQKVQYTPGKWVTVILPKKYTRAELETKFGTDVMLAEMTGFRTPESSYVNGILTYHLNFTEVTDPVAHKPYMIKPGHIKASTDADYTSPYWVTLIGCSEMGPDYRAEVPKDHALKIDAEDETEVVMYGRYQPYGMKQWEFYFQNPLKNGVYNTACVFKRVVDPAQAPTVKPFRCYWRIWLKGEAQDAGAGAKSAFFTFVDDESTPTGIDQTETKIAIEIGNIYDLNGRKLDLKKEDLPKGLFIIDGKKVMINK